jgi:hypothetical protein
MIKRAVYSLWTKPMNEEFVGFNSEKALMECFALSLHYSKKWFKEVHFITDLKGKALIDKYGLKFDYVSTELEEVLKDASERDWSLGKIYACKIQDKPFIHIDIDVILFKPLPNSFLSKDAVFQSSERGSWPHYNDMMDFDNLHYNNKPSWYDTKNLRAYCCGLLGFNRLDFLNEWWETALQHVEYLKLQNGYPSVSLMSCLIYEQQYVGCLCDKYNYNVGLLTDYAENKNQEYVTEDLANKLGYTHLIASSKRRLDIEEKITNRVIKEKIKLPHLTYDTVCF